MLIKCERLQFPLQFYSSPEIWFWTGNEGRPCARLVPCPIVLCRNPGTASKSYRNIKWWSKGGDVGNRLHLDGAQFLVVILYRWAAWSQWH